jgi:hypothetical protein
MTGEIRSAAFLLRFKTLTANKSFSDFLLPDNIYFAPVYLHGSGKFMNPFGFIWRN